MEFSVLILGSGAATPTKTRSCSGQVLRMGPRRILVDCGEGTQNNLRIHHQRIQAVDTIFISHLHGDHFFGLPGLLSTMHLCGRTEPVKVFAPIGMKQILQVIFESSATELAYPLEVVELSSEQPEVVANDKYYKVTAIPLRHTVPVFGFVFEEVISSLNLRKGVRDQYNLSNDDCVRIKNGEDWKSEDGTIVPNSELTLPARSPRRYAYCCDTAYFDQLTEWVEGVDLLCLESTFGQGFEDLAASRCHCTAGQAAMLAQKAHAHQLLMTHFSARYKEITPLLDEARVLFPNTIAAEDGHIYTVGFDNVNT